MDHVANSSISLGVQPDARSSHASKSVRLLHIEQSAWWLVAGLSALVLAWILLVVSVEERQFVVLAPVAQSGAKVVTSLASLLAALVLVLFPADRHTPRLHWLAAGLLTAGIGGLFFCYLQPLVDAPLSVNESMYQSLAIRSIVGILFAAGLVARVPPRLTIQGTLGILYVTVLLSAAIYAGAGQLPTLTHISNLEAAALEGDIVLPGLTMWYWGLSIIPFILAIGTIVGAARYYPGRDLGGWLAAAMALAAGSQLHNLFWPSVYSSVLTTANVLWLAVTGFIIVGGLLELRRTATERAARLAAEQRYSQHLADLAIRKANFTAMVAHELNSPLVAIRRHAEIVSTTNLDPLQAHALDSIQAEINVLNTLVADMQASIAIDRDDFAVNPQPLSVSRLISNAAAFARTLPGNHALIATTDLRERVMADPVRIPQVLHNLLSNAAKYSPAGASMELRALRVGGQVRIDVIDYGCGIDPADLGRIFEKFERGSSPQVKRVIGMGMGLYVSRRIIHAHGSELTVCSKPGVGSRFAFSLEVAT